jgi:NAD(P)-dependent dehydrogenase (short-subunit alcohol dehydrogenase family)
MAELDGKVAVVTGAGSGLGKAAAQVLAGYGAKVLAADISGAEKDTAASIGDAAIAFRCDVTQEPQVEAMLRAAVDRFGRLDAVLNVAGISSPALVADIDMAEYDRVLDVDLRGVIHGTKHAVRVMSRTGGGVILNWASIAGLAAAPTYAVYSAAKAAIIAFTKSAAVEYAHLGIRANTIAPGFFFTDPVTHMPADAIARMTARIPMGRPGKPKECAELAAFLISDRAPFLNGATLVIDGGQTAQLT